MSGGSYDYAYFKIEELARDIRDNGNTRRIAFKKLLEKVAVAAHDIEWVDSGDMNAGDEDEAIDAVFSELNARLQDVLDRVILNQIRTLIKEKP